MNVTVGEALYSAGCFIGLGASAQDNRFLCRQELLVCFLVAESVKAFRSKQITPYLLNKAFLAKVTSQNPRNHCIEA